MTTDRRARATSDRRPVRRFRPDPGAAPPRAGWPLTVPAVAQLLQEELEPAQVLLARHSPVLAALPGARILEIGAWDIREASWDALELTENWPAFLDDPRAFLRHLS